MGLDITSNSKNAYEIRLSIIQEARGILEAEYYQLLSKADNLFTFHLGKGDDKAAGAVAYPKPITVDDILTLATKLRSFVDNREEASR